MPFAATRQLPGEPIIVTTYTGEVTLEDVIDGSKEVAALMNKVKEPIYAVVDLIGTTSSFADIIAILKQQGSGAEGTTTDSRFAAMGIAGTSSMAKLYVAAMAKEANGGIQIPMFTSLEDGIAAMRVMIATRRKTA